MALSFTRKTYTDTSTSGFSVTASDLNKIEEQIAALTDAVNTINDKLVVKSAIGAVNFSKSGDKYEIWLDSGDGAVCLCYNKSFVGVYDSRDGSSFILKP